MRPHRLKTRRNVENLGLTRNINAALSESSGELIVLAAGDDISLPSRVSVTVSCWVKNGKLPDSMWTSVELIDQHCSIVGHWRAGFSKYGLFGKTRKLVPELLGCSHAFTRRSYDFFGDLDPQLVYEDRVLAFRSLLLGGLLPIDKPLVQYRVHSGSISAMENSAHRGNQSTEVLGRKLRVFKSYMRDLKCAKNHLNTIKYESLSLYIQIQVLKLRMKLALVGNV
jgi:glycosyltransferase involved in cell wall biosynthesis